MKKYTQEPNGKEVFEVTVGGNLDYIRVYDWDSYPEGCLYLHVHEAEEVIRKLQNAIEYHKRTTFTKKEESQ